jgi:hypothetical protein
VTEGELSGLASERYGGFQILVEKMRHVRLGGA